MLTSPALIFTPPTATQQKELRLKETKNVRILYTMFHFQSAEVLGSHGIISRPIVTVYMSFESVLKDAAKHGKI